mmetsp:Transcript_53085/g.156888  ORF Transcript_53085/g.156888 Transcript_53085/m.156888 type:complete len:362 (+) Transcript_53085:298-1383(+)
MQTETAVGGLRDMRDLRFRRLAGGVERGSVLGGGGRRWPRARPLSPSSPPPTGLCPGDKGGEGGGAAAAARSLDADEPLQRLDGERRLEPLRVVRRVHLQRVPVRLDRGHARRALAAARRVDARREDGRAGRGGRAADEGVRQPARRLGGLLVAVRVLLVRRQLHGREGHRLGELLGRGRRGRRLAAAHLVGRAAERRAHLRHAVCRSAAHSAPWRRAGGQLRLLPVLKRAVERWRRRPLQRLVRVVPPARRRRVRVGLRRRRAAAAFWRHHLALRARLRVGGRLPLALVLAIDGGTHLGVLELRVVHRREVAHREKLLARARHPWRHGERRLREAVGLLLLLALIVLLGLLLLVGVVLPV